MMYEILWKWIYGFALFSDSSLTSVCVCVFTET